MDLNLQGLRRSPEWRKNLSGYITLEGVELSDGAVRNQYGIYVTSEVVHNGDDIEKTIEKFK